MASDASDTSPEFRRAMNSRRETKQFGRAVARVLDRGDLVVLTGDLGAGKTTLVRSIARGLGVPATVPVTSPTFELVHELPGRMPVVHADLYRLTAGDDLVELGLLPRIGTDAVVLIEWGDKFAGELGSDGLWISVSFSGDARTFVVRGKGARGAKLVEALGPVLESLPRDEPEEALD